MTPMIVPLAITESENWIKGWQFSRCKHADYQLTLHIRQETSWPAKLYRIRRTWLWWRDSWPKIIEAIDMCFENERYGIASPTGYCFYSTNCKVRLGDDIVLTFFEKSLSNVTEIVRLPRLWWKNTEDLLGRSITAIIAQ